MISNVFLVAALSVGFAVWRAIMQANLYTATPAAAYDFIIVGGGTAGSLVAAELAASNKDWRVLLLEAGDGIRDAMVSEQSVPGGAPDNVAYGNIDWNYKVESQKTPLAGTQDVCAGHGVCVCVCVCVCVLCGAVCSVCRESHERANHTHLTSLSRSLLSLPPRPPPYYAR